MLPYLILTLIICVIALVGTIFVGMNPVEKNYGKSSRRRIINLSIIYTITIVLGLGGTILYIILR